MAALIRGAGDGASPGPAMDGWIHGGDDETAVRIRGDGNVSAPCDALRTAQSVVHGDGVRAGLGRWARRATMRDQQS